MLMSISYCKNNRLARHPVQLPPMRSPRTRRGMISFDLLIFMLGVVMIVYLALTIIATINYRTSARMVTVSKYHWAVGIADDIIKFGNRDGNESFRDHVLMDAGDYDTYNNGYEQVNMSIDVKTLDEYDVSPENGHRFCVTRYGVTGEPSGNVADKIRKLVVCAE